MIRDIKTTTVPQLRDVHIRDKIIKDCILLGSTLTVGMYFSRTVSCLHRFRKGMLGLIRTGSQRVKKDRFSGKNAASGRAKVKYGNVFYY